MDVMDIWSNTYYNRSVYAMTLSILIGVILTVAGIFVSLTTSLLGKRIKSNSAVMVLLFMAVILLVTGISILCVEVKL